jgi:adenylosuccinate lyase
MMEGVRRGGDRQVLHERVRIHTQSHPDDVFDRIAADPLFGIDRATIEEMARPEDYTGLARQQTERFLTEEIDPILEGQVTEKVTEELRV